MSRFRSPPSSPIPLRGRFAALIAALLATACGSDSVGPGDSSFTFFETHVTDLAHVELIVPSGAISGNEIKPHSHFRTDGSAVPIFAPIAMSLTRGTWVGDSDDYGLVFNVDKRYRLIFGHVTDPRQDIVDAIPRNDPSSILVELDPIRFAAGELIGFSSGTVEVNGIDFGFYDLATPAETPNAARYRRQSFWTKLNGVCPYDRFPQELRGGYTALFGTIGGVTVPNGPCRSLADQAVSGTVSGEWTLVSSAPDATYDTQFAVGTHLDGRTVRIAGIGGTFDVLDGVDPKTVTTEVCYVSGGSHVFLQLTSATTLEAVWGEGGCPVAFPGDSRSYER